jgi:hypothetical protein
MFRDLTGQTFGRLTVIERVQDHITKGGKHLVQWLCKCECGKTKLLRADILKQGKAVCKCNGKSCGRKHEDLTGRRFGKLVVTGYVLLEKSIIIKHKFKAKDCKSEIEVNRLYKNGSYYICQCDCGNVSYVKKSSLVGGKTKSCGCLKNKG